MAEIKKKIQTLLEALGIKFEKPTDLKNWEVASADRTAKSLKAMLSHKMVQINGASTKRAKEDLYQQAYGLYEGTCAFNAKSAYALKPVWDEFYQTAFTHIYGLPTK